MKIRLIASKVALLILIVMLVGCSRTDSYQKMIYSDDAKIVSEGDSYSFVIRDVKVSGTDLNLKFKAFNGMETVWSIDSGEEGKIIVDYTSNVQKGKFKVVLISPENNVQSILEQTAQGTTEINLLKGNNRIKIVGDNTSGEIMFRIRAISNAKLYNGEGELAAEDLPGTPDSLASPRGNTSGNIVNGGLMAGNDEYVYYRSESDGWKLYRARHDGSEREKISDDIASFINVLDGWIYYSNFSDGNKLYKIRADGTGKRKLNDCQAKHINVVGDTIYYVNSDNLTEDSIDLPYRIRTDGNENKLIAHVRCSELIYEDDWLFFTGNGQGTIPIFKMRTDGSEITMLNQVYSHFINVQKGYIYYWNVDNGRLHRMKTDGSEDTVLVNNGVDYVNVYDSWVYYLNLTDYNINRIKVDGSETQKLTQIPPDEEGLSSFSPNFIYVINENVYYRGFHSELTGDALFTVPLDGSGQIPWDVK